MATLVHAGDLHQERTIHSLMSPHTLPNRPLMSFKGSSDNETSNQLATKQVDSVR